MLVVDDTLVEAGILRSRILTTKSVGSTLFIFKDKLQRLKELGDWVNREVTEIIFLVHKSTLEIPSVQCETPSSRSSSRG